PRRPPPSSAGGSPSHALAPPPTRQDSRVADDAEQGPDAVPPADLLPLRVRAPRVRDADLVDPPPAPGHLGGDLGFETEPVLSEVEALEHLTPESLEAGLHVRQVEVGEDVRRGREEPVSDGVPEIQDTTGTADVEPRPVD